MCGVGFVSAPGGEHCAQQTAKPPQSIGKKKKNGEDNVLHRGQADRRDLFIAAKHKSVVGPWSLVVGRWPLWSAARVNSIVNLLPWDDSAQSVTKVTMRSDLGNRTCMAFRFPWKVSG